MIYFLAQTVQSNVVVDGGLITALKCAQHVEIIWEILKLMEEERGHPWLKFGFVETYNLIFFLINPLLFYSTNLTDLAFFNYLSSSSRNF